MGENITRRQLLLGAISLFLLSCSNEDPDNEVVKVVLGPVSDFTRKYNPITNYRIAILRTNNG